MILPRHTRPGKTAANRGNRRKYKIKHLLLNTRIAVIAAAAVIALATMIGATYAWSTANQSALGEMQSSANPGGRLHDDFDGQNRDIYVENFGTQNIFVRARLHEYMETGPGAGVKGEWDAEAARQNSTDKGAYLPAENNRATPLVPGSVIGDVSTWAVYTPGANQALRGYWALTTGGSKHYMPTFDKDPDSLRTDFSGTATWEEGSTHSYKTDNPVHGGVKGSADGSHSFWSTSPPPTKTDVAYLKNGEARTETHKACPTLEGEVVTAADWTAKRNSKPGPYWVIDTDGWAYWAQPLEPATATGLLLSEIKPKKEFAEDWYYALFAVCDMVSSSEIDMIRQSTDIKDGGKAVIDAAWIAPSKTPSQPYSPTKAPTATPRRTQDENRQ